MKAIYLNLDSILGLEKQTAVLTKLIRDEFAAGCGNFTGYRFDYGDGEVKEHKRWSAAVESSIDWIVRSSKTWEKVRLFRNMNGQLSVQIVDLTRRTVRAELDYELRTANRIGFAE